MPSVPPVLVAGAGPSGLVAALTLLQNDIPVRIVTKESNYQHTQRAAGIWPRTFEVFHFLRAFETHQRATPALLVREYEPGTLGSHKTFSMFASSDPTPSIPYVNPMVLGQPALEGILRSHLEKYGCFVELGTELESFKDDEEHVLAKLKKKKDGEEFSEIFEASYLIGADGAKGVTRKQLGLSFLGETRNDVTSVVGDLCLEVEGMDREHLYITGHGSPNFLMLRPTDEIAPDGFQCIMGMKDYEPKQLIADQDLMLRCMSELIGRKITIRKAIGLSEFRPNIRMVDKFRVGRVLVAGDAAHVHSPAGGQGLNSSVQDALNLAWKLSLVCKGLSPATLLDSYTTERLPVIAEMLGITTAIFNKIRSESIAGAIGREKRLNMLGVNYRSSPIVLDEFTRAEPVSAYGALEEGVLVAGDRAPDAPELRTAVTQDTRLFDVFCPVYHTVLVFALDVVSSADVLEVLGKYPRDVIRSMIILPQDAEVTAGAQTDVVVDQGGHAYRAYLVEKGEKRLVVVRPDGVVGAIVHGAEGMAQYFARIFV